MRKHQRNLWLLIASTILFTGFKKNTYPQGFLSAKSMNTNSCASSFPELPEIVISDVTVIQGDKGKTPAEIMVCLSQMSSEPVTLEYSTENGTAIAGTDYVATSGSLRFEPGEIAKWITVSIIGEVAADPDEDAPPQDEDDLHLILKNIKGAIAKKKGEIIITIIKNISSNPKFIKGKTSAYQVSFEYNGFTTLGWELKDCHVRRNGRVFLNGILEGLENVDRYDDVSYTGKLWMNINMDICSVERDEKTDPPDRFCYMSVAGLGYVTTELEIDTSAGYAYIKIDCDTTKFYRNVVGDCFSQLGGERENVPNNSIASIFNGMELHMLIDRATGRQLRTLRKGNYSHTDVDGNVTSVTVVRKIR
ncbi:MAG TPA: Calx-beta domain-containing protein [Chitinophagaceae bacterium]|nr:Calx-beta domain-containing protein [Chitinophagaceae bacterium]